MLMNVLSHFCDQQLTKGSLCSGFVLNIAYILKGSPTPHVNWEHTPTSTHSTVHQPSRFLGICCATKTLNKRNKYLICLKENTTSGEQAIINKEFNCHCECQRATECLHKCQQVTSSLRLHYERLWAWFCKSANGKFIHYIHDNYHFMILYMYNISWKL